MTNRMIPVSETLLSDMHKDAYGYRPGGLYPEFMTEDEVNAEYEQLQIVIYDEMAREARRELRAQRALESRITCYMLDYGINRGTALRWEWEGDGELRDLGYWAYDMGISYELIPMYFAELSNAGVAGLYAT